MVKILIMGLLSLICLSSCNIYRENTATNRVASKLIIKEAVRLKPLKSESNIKPKLTFETASAEKKEMPYSPFLKTKLEKKHPEASIHTHPYDDTIKSIQSKTTAPIISPELKKAKKKYHWGKVFLLFEIAAVFSAKTFVVILLTLFNRTPFVNELILLNLIFMVPFAFFVFQYLKKKEKYLELKNLSAQTLSPADMEDEKKGKRKALWAMFFSLASVIITFGVLNFFQAYSAVELLALAFPLALLGFLLSNHGYRILRTSTNQLFKFITKAAISISAYMIFYFIPYFIEAIGKLFFGI